MSTALVIFDCDGVLVDSEPIVNRAHAETMTALGYPIGEAELLERFCGMSDAEMIAILEAEWGRALPAGYAERLAARAERDYRAALRAIPGIQDVLQVIAGPVCVASSGTAEEIRLKLDITGLRRRFGDNLFSAAMVARGKPAPDLFLYAAARMDAAPEACIVVEDSLPGVEAAVAAGMTVIGFRGGSHCGPGHAARLRARGARFAIAAMPELPPLLA